MKGCIRPIKDRTTGQTILNRWELRYDLPRGADGKRKTKTKAFSGTKKDAQKELTRILKAVDDRTHVDPSKESVEKHLNWWLNSLKSDVAASTYRRYDQIVRNHLIPAFGHHRLDRLEPPHIDEYKEWSLAKGNQGSGTRGGGKLSKQSVHHHLRVLRQALSKAVERGYLAQNPADKVTLPKPDNVEAKALTPEEVDRLFTATEGTHLHTLAVLAVATGARRGELLALRWSDVDMDTGRVVIRRSLEITLDGVVGFKSPKNGKSRVVTLPAFAIETLTRHKAEQSKRRLLFGPDYADHDLILARADGTPASPDYLSRDFTALAKRTGLPVTLHDLRHTFASLALHLGANMRTVQTMLGHSNINITLGRYSHLLGGEQEEVATRLDACIRSARDGDAREVG